MDLTRSLVFVIILSCCARVEVVSVRPIRCPTNKIAPHRRVSSGQLRTFGYFYQLFGEDTPSGSNANLQEQPQPDDPDDCGEIEDYDENDLSSLNYPVSQRKRGNTNQRLFGWFGEMRPPRPSFFPGQQQPAGVPTIPRPPRRRPYTRPPYNSGGIFANNPYRPQSQQEPSDAVKPVNEHTGSEPSETWRPQVIGGALGHVVGVPARPPRVPPIAAQDSLESDPTRSPLKPYRPTAPYPAAAASALATRRPRQRPIYYNDDNNRGVFGSFLNLLF